MNHQVSYIIPDLKCPSCSAKIEQAVRKLDGILEVSVNTIAQKVILEYSSDAIDGPEIESAIKNAGYTVGNKFEKNGAIPLWKDPQKIRIALSALFFALGLFTWLSEGFHTNTPIWKDSFEYYKLFFLISALLGGLNFFPSGFRALRSFSLDMDFLMTIAIFGAIAIGEYLEAAAIAFLFSSAELLEDNATNRARNSLRALMDLTPNTAVVQRFGQEVTVTVNDVKLEETVIVRPSEKIPVDGKVIEGRSIVDQSPITGESIPVSKTVGDKVFSGTINQEGYLKIKTTHRASDSTLSRIVQIVMETEKRRAPSEQFIRRFARYYTPAITILALFIIIIPPLAFSDPFEVWFLRGLTLLVIACPCALVISTPVAIVSGITSAARNGILIKGGINLETLSEIRNIAFDKTGTLTNGRPEVTDILSLNGLPESEILRKAAALEKRSKHPISRAILERASDLELPEVSDFKSIPGQGVCGQINHLNYRIGKPDFYLKSLPEQITQLTSQGKTVVLLSTENESIGVIAVSDTVRQNCGETIKELRKTGIQKILMLTGDNPKTAKFFADELDIDEWQANLLPEEKVRVIEKLQPSYGKLAMIGDGANDAPALACASVGIAMGAAGSDTAIETADVALMTDDLSKLPYLFKLSRTAKNIIRQNIWACIFLKLALTIGVLFGMVSLITAVLVGDLGASLSVTGNALRLAKIRPHP